MKITKVTEEIIAIGEQAFHYAAKILENEGAVPWMAVIVTMDASPGASYQAELLYLPENKEQVKGLIVSRAREANAVAVIMVGEAWMTWFAEEASGKIEIIYSALRLYDDFLAMKAAKICRANGRLRVGDLVFLPVTGESRMIANILPSWKVKGQA